MSDDFSDLIKQRIEKINILKNKGINPYPLRYKRKDTAKDINEKFIDNESRRVNIAGRLKSKRIMGKTSFGDLEDFSDVIQIYAKRETLGTENYEIFKMLDIGDFDGLLQTAFVVDVGFCQWAALVGDAVLLHG